MAFFNSAVNVLQTLVIALGAGLGIWGVINLLEGYGNDNPGAKSQGMKQLMAGGGVALIGGTLTPKIAVLLRNISKAAPMRKRARWPTYRLPRPFFFCAHLSALCFFFPFRLTFHFQNTVDILLDNVVFLDLLFQLPIVGIQGFFLLLKCCVLCLQGGKAW